MARSMTTVQEALAIAWLHIEKAYWREDELGKCCSSVYGLSVEFERRYPKIREWARKLDKRLHGARN